MGNFRGKVDVQKGKREGKLSGATRIKLLQESRRAKVETSLYLMVRYFP
jgi:hypothetical protein